MPFIKNMEQWSGEHRSFCVKSFYKNGDSATIVQRLFRNRFNILRHGRVPSAHAINSWVKNFEETGSALKSKHKGAARTVRTPENIDRVRTAVTRSPKRSVIKHALALNISEPSVRRILHKDLSFHPYKIQIVQELKDADMVARMNFCQEMLQRLDGDENLIHHMFMSDEAHFHLNGYVNKQNSRYWSAINPLQLHQKPLHSPKVTVWCALSSSGIIGPYFFQDDRGNTTTVTAARYTNMITTFLTEELVRFPQITWFQQDGATSHTARVTMTALRELFPNHIISKNGDIIWPARSPDLSACDFFLWGLLKSKVYVERPQTLEELRLKIQEEVARITPAMLRRVMENFRSRLQECVDQDGAYLSNVI
jgi:transposase